MSVSGVWLVKNTSHGVFSPAKHKAIGGVAYFIVLILLVKYNGFMEIISRSERNEALRSPRET
jgi:hypothetical protein